MELTILGSGGAIPTPRLGCICAICSEARLDTPQGISLRRNSSSMYINNINFLIDAPESIGASLDKQKIEEVNYLFLTHWHPDHTFGLRVILESNYDFLEKKAIRQLPVYLGQKTYDALVKYFPSIEYYKNVTQTLDLKIIDDQDQVRIGNILLNFVGYTGKNSDWYGLIIEQNGKKAGYFPCDTIEQTNFDALKGLDVLIHETGIFSFDKVKTEISFPDLIKRLHGLKVGKTYLTHIEEVELNRFGNPYLKKLEEENKDLNLYFVKDGQKIIL